MPVGSVKAGELVKDMAARFIGYARRDLARPPP
jgi:hypothetical protein